MDIEKVKAYSCPIEAAMGVIGGKYKSVFSIFISRIFSADFADFCVKNS